MTDKDAIPALALHFLAAALADGMVRTGLLHSIKARTDDRLVLVDVLGPQVNHPEHGLTRCAASAQVEPVRLMDEARAGGLDGFAADLCITLLSAMIQECKRVGATLAEPAPRRKVRTHHG